MTNKGKYETTNPVKRYLLNRFLSRVRAEVTGLPGSVLDVGIGEGLFWQDGDSSRVFGIDIRHGALVEAAQRTQARVACGSALALPFDDDTFDVVTAIEILEHLMEPLNAVSEISRVTKGSAVISVPWEPWFSLLVLAGTGSHPRRLGREPEHVQAFGPKSLADTLACRFSTVDVRPCFPWLVARVSGPVSDRGQAGPQDSALLGSDESR